jgi:hypothetical protein
MLEHKAPTHVLVQHMARSRDTRAERRGTPGNRCHDVRLGNGRRIRRIGERFNEVALEDLAENQETLLEMVKCGRIRIYDPETEELIPYETLAGAIPAIAEVSAESSNPIELPSTESTPIEPSPPVDNEHVAPGAEQFSDEVIAGAAEVSVEPLAESPAETLEVVGQEDVTKPDGELSATIAAIDMAEQGKKVEEEPSAQEEPQAKEEAPELDEAELMALSRNKLNKAAKKYGIEDPESLQNKQAVVDAMKAIKKGE